MAKGTPPAPVTVTSAAIGRPLSRMPVDPPGPHESSGDNVTRLGGCCVKSWLIHAEESYGIDIERNYFLSRKFHPALLTLPFPFRCVKRERECHKNLPPKPWRNGGHLRPAPQAGKKPHVLLHRHLEH